MWDNYPIQNPHFNSIWKWFEKNVENEKFVISDVALEEVKQKVLYDSLKADVPESELFIEILDKILVDQKSVVDLKTIGKIKNLLEIEEDNYHSNVVGENDLFIVAIAKRTNSILVTNEGRQLDIQKIKVKGKYKIPAVCNLSEVQVDNINLTELLHLNTLW